MVFIFCYWFCYILSLFLYCLILMQLFIRNLSQLRFNRHLVFLFTMQLMVGVCFFSTMAEFNQKTRDLFWTIALSVICSRRSGETVLLQLLFSTLGGSVS